MVISSRLYFDKNFYDSSVTSKKLIECVSALGDLSGQVDMHQKSLFMGIMHDEFLKLLS